MKYTDMQRIDRIVSTTRKLLDYLAAQGITKEDVLNQEPLRWTITTPLYNIGEQVYCLSRELKERYPAVPWSAIAGIRHRLVHDYEGINWSVLVEVIYDELPAFIETVGGILRAMEE